MRLTDTDRSLAHLLELMTVEEKIGQLTMLTAEWAVTGPTLSSDYLGAVRAGRAGSLLNLWGSENARTVQKVALEETRLGIPLILGFDVVHGHRTIFPVPLGEAASFNPELWHDTAKAAAEEATADGLSLTFAPMLDVSRDPRWGRIVEGPGEDTLVARRMAVAKVKGFQGGNLANPSKLAATAKHFVAYGAPLAGRDYASVDISARDLHEIYLPPFADAVSSGCGAIMPGFHDLAGVPLTAHIPLLEQLVRRDWRFDGVMISDYNAIAELIQHGVAADLVEASAAALKAGVDIDMMADAYHRGLPEALARGLVTMADIDRAVMNVLTLKQRLGLFDDPYARGASPITPQHQASIGDLAREAACQSIVVLTNRNDILPLDPAYRRIAVIGPLADNPRDMLGSWSAAGPHDSPISILAGLRAALPDTEIVHAAGTAIDSENAAGIEPAVAYARSADLVLLCLGESADMSGEASSRARPILPLIQQRLAEAVIATGKKCVVNLTSGRPLVLGALADQADAVLATWQLGSQAGHALADILTGKVEPSGRLPLSWPIDVGQIPIFFARRRTGRPTDPDQHYTSKYLDLPVDPLFPFGHGLSYAQTSWGNLTVSPPIFGAEDVLTVTVEITNERVRASIETVFLFIHDPVASVARPLLELKDFRKVVVESRHTIAVSFSLPARDLAFAGAEPALKPVLEPGRFEILVGPSADRAQLQSISVELRQ